MPALKLVHVIFMISMVILVAGAVITAWRRKDGWFAWHRLLAPLGAACGSAGLLAMLILKTQRDFPHFQSPHSLGGVATLVLVLGTMLIGIRITRGAGKLARLHRPLGRVAILSGLLIFLAKVPDLLK